MRNSTSLLDTNKDGSTPPTDTTETTWQKESTIEQKSESKHENVQESNSQPIESKKDEMDKLINIMQNVVNQPGFEFLAGTTKLNGKPAVLRGEINTADKRERWLYDVMMENWRERPGEGAESKSGSVEEMVGKIKGGIFSVKARKVSGGTKGGEGFDLVTDGCEAQKTREEFVSTVMHHKDDKHEIFIIGDVGDGKMSKEDMIDIATLPRTADHEEISPEQNDKSKGCGVSEKDENELDEITGEEIVSVDSSKNANDALEEVFAESRQDTSSSVFLGKGPPPQAAGGKDESVTGNIASHDITYPSQAIITEPSPSMASDNEADVTKDEIKDGDTKYPSESNELREQYASKDTDDDNVLLIGTCDHEFGSERERERTSETSEGNEMFDTLSNEPTESGAVNVRFDGENVESVNDEAKKNLYIKNTKQEGVVEEYKVLKQTVSSDTPHAESEITNVEQVSEVTADFESGTKSEKSSLDDRTSEGQGSIYDSLIEQDLNSENLHYPNTKESLDTPLDGSPDTEEKHTPN